MEPILPAPHNYETGPPSEEAQNSMPLPLVSPETAPNTSVEGTRETKSGASQAPSLSPSGVVPPQAGSMSPAAPQPGDLQVGATASPLIADDVDVIEKEWVDRAKKIVSATKDDPHQQEKEVSKLQADYLLKRYNKQIKLTE